MKMKNCLIAAIFCLALFAAPSMAQTGEEKTVDVALSHINRTTDSPAAANITVTLYNSGENFKTFNIQFFGNINSSYRSAVIELGPREHIKFNETYFVKQWSDDTIRVRACWGGHCSFYQRVTIYAVPPLPDIAMDYNNTSQEVVIRMNNYSSPVKSVKVNFVGKVEIQSNSSKEVKEINETLYPASTNIDVHWRLPITALNGTAVFNGRISIDGVNWFELPALTTTLSGPEQPLEITSPAKQMPGLGSAMFLFSVMTIGLLWPKRTRFGR